MRIEGTYTFAAPIERVFAALADPEAIARAVPGSERVMQMGPAGADGASAFELRLRTEDGHAASASLRATDARRPTYLHAELRGHGPLGSVTGRGRIDLVAQEEHTIGAYVWDVDLPALADERQHAALAAGQILARAICERLGEDLRLATPSPTALLDEGVHGEGVHGEGVNGRPAVRMLRLRTARGQIVALRAVAPELPAGAHVWALRAMWMGIGLGLGVGALAVALAVLHRLVGEDD
jgi:carbon monoxide dehydrogenase subunit G